MQVLKEIPLDEIAEINEMGRRCHGLHAMPPMYATLELEVKDPKSGEVLTRYGDLSRSWTRNYYNALVCNMFSTGSLNLGNTYGSGYLQVKSTGGTTPGVANYVVCTGGGSAQMRASNYQAASGWWGVAGGATVGLVAGRGSTAESLNDYVLITPIAEGIGANQMNYQLQAAPTVTWESGDKKFKTIVQRLIINNSPGTISVAEVGIYGFGTTAQGAISIFCWARDVISPAVDVVTPSQLWVTYTLWSPAYP